MTELVTPFPHATTAGVLEGIEEQYVPAVDEYLSHYIAPDAAPERGRCPNCKSGGFGWGVAWGAGHCYSCDWPGRLYHVVTDRRDEDFLVCSATCNGHRVCEATRGEHVPKEIRWHAVESGETSVEIELQCPNPTPPPGLRLPFTSRYHAPEIARFTLLLWAHPDFVTAGR